MKSNEHFISLRDYDFVGEDPRLKAALAERMIVLQGDVSDQKTSPRGPRAPASSGMQPPATPGYKPEPDYLHSSLKFPQLVNVSLDYAELYNASELFPQMNASWYPPARGLRGADPFPGQGGRRVPQYKDPTYFKYNEKILDLMKQIIYGAQIKMSELDSLIQKYEADPRFRMAYTYNRLDEWLADLRDAYRSVTIRRNRATRVKRIIYYYEHSLRINIDITYSIELLVFLHNEGMKLMEKLLPAKQRQQLKDFKKAAKAQEELAKQTGP